MKYKINQGLIIQKLGGKTAIFDSEKSIFHTFNESASYIFKLIKKGAAENKIILNLVKKYGIDQNKAKNDFNELLINLKKKKIISSVPPKRKSK
ncbi:PqqD family protein [Patescibacteria group bacterium]|nr:PqqD family protein [Patescibacteria group bacterium]